MSASLNSVAVTLFDSEVKHSYQNGRLLREAVRVKNQVVGDTTKFRKMGKGLATQRTAPSADAVPMNVAHSLVTCVLTDWNAPEYTDIFDKATVNFDEVRELAQTITSALGRREDQLIIDVLDAASPGTSIANGNTGLSVAKIIQAASALTKQGVPSKDRYAVVTADGLADLLSEEKVGSSDYNNVKALVQGEINTFMGFKFIVVEDRDEGGLTVSADDIVDSYFFHKTAVAVAIGMDISTKVDWSTDKDSWKSTGYLKAGACVIDENGIVKVSYDNTPD